jgi:hypothetical protein
MLARRRTFDSIDADLARDPEKACPGLDPGWKPVFGKDHAQNKNLERDDDSKRNHPALRQSDF